jgi:hypothetical protein
MHLLVIPNLPHILSIKPLMMAVILGSASAENKAISHHELAFANCTTHGGGIQFLVLEFLRSIG